MHKSLSRPLAIPILLMGVGGAPAAHAAVSVQCPGDTDGDARPELGAPGYDPSVTCAHLVASDGYVNMGDGKLQYIFGYSDATGMLTSDAAAQSVLAANFPAPTLFLKEGQQLYLTLTNIGFKDRPDLFDPHSVHFHGFPNASAVFDGEPEGSVSINPGSSLTYYYNVTEPGTYMYHCHVESAEHMQMGMLGNLYVQAGQNDLPSGTNLNGFTHQAGFKYVYNDGDGSTRYDVEYPIQIGSFDPVFHDASMNTQPLPFAEMKDTYPMLNGRGYPQTVDTAQLPNSKTGQLSQKIHALISAQQGQKILLRISNLNITAFHTLSALGLPMKIVGTGAKLLRGPGAAGKTLYYNTASVTLGGGEAVDVIIDTTGVPTGTYYLYSTNLNYLSNNTEDFGGMMTEIRVNPL